MTNILIIRNEFKNSIDSLHASYLLKDVNIVQVTDLTQAQEYLDEFHFKLAVIDIHSTKDQKTTLIQKLQKTPVIFCEEDQESSFINAFIKGINQKIEITTGKVEYKGLVLDPYSKSVTFDIRSLKLTKKEFNILYLLAINAERIVTRDQILNAFYQGRELFERTVDSHISHLRMKLNNLIPQTFELKSKYGEGYILKVFH